jgi:hypothetical protein
MKRSVIDAGTRDKGTENAMKMALLVTSDRLFDSQCMW